MDFVEGFKFLNGGLDGGAVGMAEHDDQPRAVAFGGEFNAAHLRGRHDVAGHADDKEIAEAVVEYNLHRQARIGAAEHNGKGFVALHHFAAALAAGEVFHPA